MGGGSRGGVRLHLFRMKDMDVMREFASMISRMSQKMQLAADLRTRAAVCEDDIRWFSKN